MCYSFISKIKESFLTASGQSSYLEFLFWFSSAILLSKMKSLFFSLWKFVKFLMSFSKPEVSFLQIFHHSSVSWSINPLYLFSSNIVYFVQKQHIKVHLFKTFECSGQNSSNFSCQFWNDKSIPLQILYRSSLSWHITPL